MNNLLNEYVEPYWLMIVRDCNVNLLLFFGSLLLHVICFILFKLPYILLDIYTPYIKNYKIQKDKENEFTFKIVIKSLLNNLLLDVPLLLSLIPVFNYLEFNVTEPLPKVTDFIIAFTLSIFIDEIIQYWFHRALHIPYIYKRIHKHHHESSRAPTVLDGENANILEIIVFGVSTMIGVSIYHRHLFIFWLNVSFKVFTQSETHSGYDIPYNPTKLIPYWSGAKIHDFHHRNYKYNYATTFTIIDKIFGTYKDI